MNISKIMIGVIVCTLCLGACLSLADSAEAADNDQGDFSAYSYTFNFAFEGTNAQSILWDFGFNDENGARVQSTHWNPQNITFPSKGTYTVTQTVMNTEGSYVSVLMVHVLGTPELTFSVGMGSLVPTQYVKVGETPVMPDAPTREGHYFAGWYKDVNCVNLFYFDTPITQHTTLYAKWSTIPVTLPDQENDPSNAFPIIPLVVLLLGFSAFVFGFCKKLDNRGKSKKNKSPYLFAIIIGIVIMAFAYILYSMGITDTASFSTMLPRV